LRLGLRGPGLGRIRSGGRGGDLLGGGRRVVCGGGHGLGGGDSAHQQEPGDSASRHDGQGPSGQDGPHARASNFAVMNPWSVAGRFVMMPWTPAPSSFSQEEGSSTVQTSTPQPASRNRSTTVRRRKKP